MVRQLKPYKVDTVVHNESGLKADVMLDRNDNTFFAKLMGDTYEDETAAGVKGKLWEAMGAWEPPKWRQIILVEFEGNEYSGWRHDDYPNGCELRFSFDRREVSTKASGTEMYRPFLPRGPKFGEEEPNDWEIEYRKRNEDWHYWQSSGRTIMDYDDVVWRTLCELKARTDQLTKRLHDLMDGDSKKLMAVGKSLAGLLPPAKSK